MGGIYIHIPFCSSKCPYCDFYSHRSTEDKMTEYTNALLDEIKTLRRVSQYIHDGSFTADTLYIGGGTPSVLKGEHLEQIISSARNKFRIPDDGEITVECNPASPIETLIPHLVRCGVNRISLGMQSAVERERRLLGRSADRNRISQVINLFKDAGIRNISLDVMLGIPEQSANTLAETLDFAISSGANHISAYILKIEEGTFFDTHYSNFSFPDEDTVCQMYSLCVEQLKNNGFNQYEISNFAKKGFESRHNTKYWLLEDYLGIGAAAHSLVNGKRFYFPDDADGFIKGIPPVFDGEGNSSEEYIMLRLRLTKGLKLRELSALYGDDAVSNIKGKAPLLSKQGLIYYDGDTVALTEKGFLLSNTVIAEFL